MSRNRRPALRPAAARGRCLHGALLACLALLLLAPAATPAFAATRLFGSTETANQNLKPFKKWNGMLERYFADVQRDFDRKKRRASDCKSSFFNRCHFQDWERLIAGLEGKNTEEQLRAVNHFMNSARYIGDPRNWGVPDYWATPGQFLQRDGDCEDYAIAKYLTLKRLGVPVERMRIVVLQDLNLQIPHAVLAVYVGDRIMILDNQIRSVVEHSRIRHYQPIFSINEQRWWLHRHSRRPTSGTAEPGHRG